mmetsp:Transcript_1110/g.3398  ORF Transcript_1110/g.3398 Transcript_1110/m.3398 type:complete len:227 (+) Transcript_1110:1417-2097(+)
MRSMALSWELAALAFAKISLSWTVASWNASNGVLGLAVFSTSTRVLKASRPASMRRCGEVPSRPDSSLRLMGTPAPSLSSAFSISAPSNRYVASSFHHLSRARSSGSPLSSTISRRMANEMALLVVESFMLWPRAFMSGASMSSSASLSSSSESSSSRPSQPSLSSSSSPSLRDICASSSSPSSSAHRTPSPSSSSSVAVSDRSTSGSGSASTSGTSGSSAAGSRA